MSQAEALRAEIARAARTLGAPDDVTPHLERPRDPAFGDWATNVAMTLTKTLGRKPRAIGLHFLRRYLLADGKTMLLSRNWHPAELFAYTTKLRRGAER